MRWRATSIVTRGDAITAIPGRYGWEGGLGTSWYSDPNADLVVILLTQRSFTSPIPPDVHQDFWKVAYRSG